MLKKFLAGATTALLALGLVSLVAAPAQAHTGDLNVTAVCNTQTKQYDFTATLTISQTGEDGSTMWKVGTSTWTGVPSSNAGLDRGPVISHGAQTITLGTFSLPGNTTGLGPWVYAYTTWTPDNYQKGSDGQLYHALDGTCGDDTSKNIAICHWTASGHYNSESPDVDSIIKPNGHNSHVNDIIPPFTYTKNGQSGSYPGKNWTLGGQQIWNNGCKVPGAPPAPTYTEAVCTAAGQTGTATVTIPSGVTGAQYWIKSSNNGNTYATIAQGSTPTFPAGTTVQVKVTPLAGYELSITAAEFPAHTFTNVASKCVQPAAPTVVQSQCTTPGNHSVPTYTIVPTAHVTYKVNGQTVTGTTQVSGALPKTVTVTTVLDNGYILVGQGSFVLNFTNPGDCVQDVSVNVGFSNAVCTLPGESGDATYTLPDVTGVTYTVTINGSPADGTPGTHSVTPKNATVVVDVTAGSGYHLTSASHNTWTYTDPGACQVDAAVSTQPSFTQTVCIAGVPGGITPASYTLYDADHISYEVSTDNSTFTTKLPGTWDLAPGQDIWIHAIADSGYLLIGPGAWHYTSADLGTSCDSTVDYTTPSATDAVCVEGESTPGSYTLADVAHVTYDVKVNGNVTTDVAPGTYTAQPGDVVIVTATADSGWIFESGENVDQWTFTFTNDGLCAATPVEPTVTDQVCTVGEFDQGVYTDGAIVIPDTTGVQYTIDGTNVDAGSHTVAPGAHTVAAIALTNYKLQNYDGPWTLTSAFADICGDLPSHPIVEPQVVDPTGCGPTGTYTLSNDLGVDAAVIWTVDGQLVAAGPHSITAGTTVHIHAEPNAPVFGFTEGTQQDWTVTFTIPASCGELKTLALTGGELPTGLIGGGALLLVAGLSLLSVHLLRRRRGEV